MLGYKLNFNQIRVLVVISVYVAVIQGRSQSSKNGLLTKDNKTSSPSSMCKGCLCSVVGMFDL